MVLLKAYRKKGVGYALGMLREYVGNGFRLLLPQKFSFGYRSLRKIVKDLGPLPDDEESTNPLRKGR